MPRRKEKGRSVFLVEQPCFAPPDDLYRARLGAGGDILEGSRQLRRRLHAKTAGRREISVNDDLTATAERTLDAVIEGDTKITLGENAIKTIRTALDTPDACDPLNELALALGAASVAVSALWWLARGNEQRP